MELFHQFSEDVVSDEGHRYVCRVYAEPADKGHFHAWLAFIPLEEDLEAVTTPRETTQPGLQSLSHWVAGLSSTYLDGALERAIRHSPSERLSAVATRAARDGVEARLEAERLEALARNARQRAEVAEEIEERTEEQLRELEAGLPHH